MSNLEDGLTPRTIGPTRDILEHVVPHKPAVGGGSLVLRGIGLTHVQESSM